jgi:hypothetical protein
MSDIYDKCMDKMFKLENYLKSGGKLDSITEEDKIKIKGKILELQKLLEGRMSKEELK